MEPLSSQVPMFMLCFIGGGGIVAPLPKPMLGFGFSLGCGFAGFLAIAAHDVGLGAEELTGGMLLAAMLLIPGVPPKGDPTVFVTADMSEPSLSPAIP